MKTITLIPIMAALSIMAQEIVDLGRLSTRRAIVLEKWSPDLATFQIEIFPRNWPTNIVTITKTNEFLTLNDFDRVPSGDVIIKVKQVFEKICEDGSEPPFWLYKVDIRRYDPSATLILTEDQQWEVVRALAEAERNAPPIPGQIKPPHPHPQIALPGGTNKTYGEHIYEMFEHFAKTGRRSE